MPETPDRITPRRADYARWYLDVIREAKLADNSPVRGCMILRPNGYAIWELMQRDLDRRFKETGHENAYFPLFIPQSLLSKEAEQFEGFAKECAVVTHHRLVGDPERGGVMLDPEAVLAEPLIIRPTSETIIWNAYRDWIQSYRDLPLLINQWANVVRWELRTRPFLRTTEFLWQEGHTAHASAEEAIAESRRMLDIYSAFAEEVLAIPTIRGSKSDGERFPGAVESLSIEALMQDNKALQAGTSHFLGQNFARAFDVQFTSSDGGREYVYATSWGVSTRLIGALIMTHSDDNGLVLPPPVAARQVVIVPIAGHQDAAVSAACHALHVELSELDVRSHIDSRENLALGAKIFDWEVQGVPVRVEIGPRDIADGKISLARRDVPGRNGRTTHIGPGAAVAIRNLLEEIHESLLARARARLVDHSRIIDSRADFERFLAEGGGLAWVHWGGDAAEERQLAEQYQTSIRNIPFEDQGPAGTDGPGMCPFTGRASQRRVIMAQAY